MNIAPIVFLALLTANVSFAEVTVCNLNKIVKSSSGAESMTSCKLTIDSNDFSGGQGSGGISHVQSMGTLTSDCTGYPADYDFTTRQIKPFQMWDQRKYNADDIKNLFDMITDLGYLKNGSLGFDLTKVSSVEWYAGGFGAILTNLYVTYDNSGKKLGTVLVAGMSPTQSFQGCYIK